MRNMLDKFYTEECKVASEPLADYGSAICQEQMDLLEDDIDNGVDLWKSVVVSNQKERARIGFGNLFTWNSNIHGFVGKSVIDQRCNLQSLGSFTNTLGIKANPERAQALSYGEHYPTLPLYEASIFEYCEFEQGSKWSLMERYAPRPPSSYKVPEDCLESTVVIFLPENGVWNAKHVVEMEFDGTDAMASNSFNALFNSGGFKIPEFDMANYRAVAGFHIRERLPASLVYDTYFHTHVAQNRLPMCATSLNLDSLIAGTELVYLFVVPKDMNSHPIISHAALPKELCACNLLRREEMKAEDKIKYLVNNTEIVPLVDGTRDHSLRCVLPDANPLETLFRLAPRVGDNIVICVALKEDEDDDAKSDTPEVVMDPKDDEEVDSRAATPVLEREFDDESVEPPMDVIGPGVDPDTTV